MADESGKLQDVTRGFGLPLSTVVGLCVGFVVAVAPGIIGLQQVSNMKEAQAQHAGASAEAHREMRAANVETAAQVQALREWRAAQDERYLGIMAALADLKTTLQRSTIYAKGSPQQ